MLNAIKSWAHSCYRQLSPFYRIPIQVMPESWDDQVAVTVLPNPHLVHDIISQLIKANPHVGDCVRMLDGEYLMHAAVEEMAIDRGVLWINLFPLYSTLSVVGDTSHEHQIPPANTQRVCAENWDKLGVYQFFVYVSHRGFRYQAALKAIKDERKYAVQCNPRDPVQSWQIPLDGEAMERLGFNKQFH